MDLEVGSNLYQNTDGTIEIEGVPQIHIALKPNALLINFALFDANGRMTAKLVDSTLMVNAAYVRSHKGGLTRDADACRIQESRVGHGTEATGPGRV